MSELNFNEIHKNGDNQISDLSVNLSDNNGITKQNVIKLNDVYYSYGKEKVLNGLTMSVTNGSIYGLLGASGCGKTTTLRILIGGLRPSSGTVSVFGNIPGSVSSQIPGSGVGYMPQDYALSSLFTINESMIYFSKLNQMKSIVVSERIKYLSTLLKLPDGDKSCAILSGGEKRRVSLAIALLHEPPLLILDEPTVGVDSLLRATIWDHLKEICANNGQTIIITTHYIEEAKASHCIGMMRKGKLLIEDDPQIIIQKTNESSLENAFLKLSHEQEIEPNERTDNKNIKKDFHEIEVSAANSIENCVENPMENSVENSMVIYNKSTDRSEIHLKPKQNSTVLTALLWKNFILFKKNIVFVSFYMTVLPFMLVAYYALFMGVNPKHIPMGVFNEDSPPLSSKFIIDNIDTTIIDLIDFDNLNDAIESVKNYYTHGVIIFPKNYTQSMQIALFDCDDDTDKTKINGDSFNNDLTNEENDTINLELKKNIKLMTQIDLLLDNTNQIVIRTVEKELYDAFKRVADKTKDILEGSLTELPIESPVNKIDPPIYGKKDSDLRDFYIHGIVFITIFPFALSITGLIILIERKDRIMERSYASGVTINQFLLSHFISQSFICAIQVISAQLCIYFVYGYECKGSIILTFLLYLNQAIIGISFSLFLSSLCDNETNALFLIVGTLYFVVGVSGAFWPRQAYANYFRYVIMVSPHGLNFDAIRTIYARGWGLSSSVVLLGFFTSYIWIIGFTLIAFYMFNKRI